MSRSTRRAAVFACALLFAATAAGAQTSRNATFLANVNTSSTYSNCTSYIAGDGREYAALGTGTGTQIFRITDPSAPVLVGTIVGPSSAWREMKQYRDHLYIVSEGTGTGKGLQVVRMTNPDAPLLVKTYTATFQSAHTVTVDTTRALLYANGTANGMHVLSLASPENPVELGVWTARYVHDLHVRGTYGYASNIFDGVLTILDLTYPGQFREITHFTTPGAFTHNAWTDKTGNYLYCTDEIPSGTLSTWNISDTSNVFLTANNTNLPGDIVHNVHVKGDTAFVSYYTAGIRLFDLSDPSLPVEFGYYDTYAGASGGFNGDWGVDPFFPSGVFIGSDIQTGLYVLRPNPQYGIIRGTVTDAVSTAPIAGATVEVLGTTQTLITSPIGKYAFSPDPATYMLRAGAFNHTSVQHAQALALGVTSTVDFALPPLPVATLDGVVKRASDSSPLVGAVVRLLSTPLSTVSAGGGAYSFATVPHGLHTVTADYPGFIPFAQTLSVSGPLTQDLSLTAAPFYDNVETDMGWSLAAGDDNASTGRWVRADPVGSGGGLVQTENDNTPAPGVTCFVTANGTVGGSNVGEADVDGGKTTLTSPAFDLSAISNPAIVWYEWYSNDAGSNPGAEDFDVELSNNNGASWTLIRARFDAHEFWERNEVRVLDYMSPTNLMKIRFTAHDYVGSVVEAAVDDISYYSIGQATGVGEGSPVPRRAAIVLEALGPSPAHGSFAARFTLAEAAPVTAELFDASGRLVRSLATAMYAAGPHDLRWDGRTNSDRFAGAGIYCLRVSSPTGHADARIVWMP